MRAFEIKSDFDIATVSIVEIYFDWKWLWCKITYFYVVKAIVVHC